MFSLINVSCAFYHTKQPYFILAITLNTNFTAESSTQGRGPEKEMAQWQHEWHVEMTTKFDGQGRSGDAYSLKMANTVATATRDRLENVPVAYVSIPVFHTHWLDTVILWLDLLEIVTMATNLYLGNFIDFTFVFIASDKFIDRTLATFGSYVTPVKPVSKILSISRVTSMGSNFRNGVKRVTLPFIASFRCRNSCILLKDARTEVSVYAFILFSCWSISSWCWNRNIQIWQWHSEVADSQIKVTTLAASPQNTVITVLVKRATLFVKFS